MSDLLTKEAILNAVDLDDYEVVNVPEWGGKVRVRGFTGDERDIFETEVYGPGEFKGRVRAAFCALGIVDENGERLFSKSEIEALGKKAAAPLDRIASVIRRKSGMYTGAEKEMEKNSGKGQSEDSTLD